MQLFIANFQAKLQWEWWGVQSVGQGLVKGGNLAEGQEDQWGGGGQAG